MQCDMCGKPGSLFLVQIEGTLMNVCEGCTSFGKVIREPVNNRIIKKQVVKEETPVPLIKEDYAFSIKSAREKKGLTQELLAKKVGEKESLIQNMESGHFEPSIALAKKLEKFLGIQLIDDDIPTVISEVKTKQEGMTIADFIKKS